MKAPLKGIANLAEFLKEDLREVEIEGVQKSLDLIQDGAKKLEGLIMGILEYSKVGSEVVNEERININQFLGEICDRITSVNKIKYSSEIPEIISDRVILGQKIQNLLSNAVNHNDKGENEEVTVSVEKQGDLALFKVKDNGPGINQKYHEKIFRLFEKLDPGKSTGTGIGLTIVKKMVDTIGAEIQIESEPEKGTTFIIVIPIK